MTGGVAPIASVPEKWEPEDHQRGRPQVVAQKTDTPGHRSKNIEHRGAPSSFRVPNELLVEIIRLALASTCQESSATSWWLLKTTAVCSRWRGVLTGAPLLWQTIDLAGCEDFLRLLLARSGNARLHLVFAADHVHSSITKEVLISMLRPHFPRVSRVCLSFSNVGAMLPLQFLVTSVGDLTNLNTIDLSMDTSVEPKRIFKVTSPPRQSSIRHLSLSSVVLIWPSMILSALVSLELSNISFYRHRNSQDILLNMLLEARKTLETFTYTGESDDLGPLVDTAYLLITLPRMRRFRLCALAADVASILVHISLPPTAHLDLEITHNGTHPGVFIPEDAPMFSEILPLANPRCLPTLSDARCLMVWSQPTVAKVYADSEHTKFWRTQPWRSRGYVWPASTSDFARGDPCRAPSLSISYDLLAEAGEEWQLERILTDLGRCFPPTVEILVLRCTMYPVLYRNDLWSAMLSSFPNLKQLDIITDDCCAEHFPYLLAPTPLGTPCAHLQHLSLSFDPSLPGGMETYENLTYMLEAREREGCRLSSLTLWLEHVNHTLASSPVAFTTPLIASESWMPREYKEFQTDLERLVDEVTAEVSRKSVIIREDSEDEGWEEEDSDARAYGWGKEEDSDARAHGWGEGWKEEDSDARAHGWGEGWEEEDSDARACGRGDWTLPSPGPSVW